MGDIIQNDSDFSVVDDSEDDPDYQNSSSTSENGENLENNEQKRKGKKRMRHGSWQKTMKLLRDSGKRYKTYRGHGRDVEERKIGDACKCKKKCFENISQEERETVFSKFWSLSEYDIQNAYLLGCLSKNDIKRKTKKRNTRRTQSICYVVGTQRVCKDAFISLHGIGRGRIECLVKKLKHNQMLPERDGRGRHTEHKKKYDEDDLAKVREFIDSLPKYESHYSRSANHSRVYMAMEYNNANLYEEYKNNFCVNNDIEPVSIDKFRRIITEEYNISFKTPKSDTCAECDAVKIAMEQAKLDNNNNELKALKMRHELHLRKAQAARDLLKEVTEKAASDPNIHVISFDLQQALPTPKLTTGPCFYKQKLWCYNLSVHRCGGADENGYFFYWDEVTAKRESIEIASCLEQYFEKNNVSGDTLYAFSDNCCGQNKNYTILGFWLHLLAIGKFRKIIHVFLQSGHSMMPSDRDFGLVEKFSRRKDVVYDPEQWGTIMKNCNKKRPFSVYRMKTADFLNYTEYRQFFNQNIKTRNQQNFSITSCVKLELDVSDSFILRAYQNYNALPDEISLKKRGRTMSIENFVQKPNQKYSGKLAIDETKLQHVLSCLKWIPPIHHDYYYSINAVNNNV